MKDELNGGGAGAGGVRRLARGGWSAMQEVVKSVKPRAVGAPQERRGGRAGGAGWNLMEVYRVLGNWPAQFRGPVHQYAFDLALNRVLGRIVRDGAGVLQFLTMRDVYAYAKRTRATAMIDAERHLEVVKRHLDSYALGSGGRMNGEYLRAPVNLIAADPFESMRFAEFAEWLAVRIGDEDSALLLAVHAEGHSVAELSRQTGVAESTIRSRLLRATHSARVQYEADGVSLN
jgi:hypothetical protein